MRKEQAGGGALVDLGSHVIDLVRYLPGEFDSVRAHLRTFFKERPVQRGSIRCETVTVDDVAWFQVLLANGTWGTIRVFLTVG